jgi:hypothetical protein
LDERSADKSRAEDEAALLSNSYRYRFEDLIDAYARGIFAFKIDRYVAPNDGILRERLENTNSGSTAFKYKYVDVLANERTQSRVR